MKYYFINTDFKTLNYSPHDIWIENNLAFTGGPIEYGKLLQKLKPDDICLMYVNTVGIMAIGRVMENWDGKKYIPPMLYSKPDDEYRIKVDWFLDLREHPISTSELRRLVGWQPSQALQGVKNPQGKLIQNLGLVHEAESLREIGLSLADEISEADILYEGAKHQIYVNAYERNPKARQKCISHYGWRCFICGFDFGAVYGKIGEAFIHVHHLLQLSEINERYVVDPIKDLRPICPNCHAIIHRRRPPYRIDEIQRILGKVVR